MPGDSKGLLRPGDYFPAKFARFYNRTGAAVVRGQVAMMDLSGTQSETTSIVPGGTGAGTSIWENLGPITQAAYDNGYACMVAVEDIADNAIGLWCLRSPYIEIAVVDADVSTTDVVRGSPLCVLVTQASSAGGALTTGGAAVQAFVSGTAMRPIGQALEAAAADSTDTDRLINASNHLRWCVFTGGYPLAGFTDT